MCYDNRANGKNKYAVYAKVSCSMPSYSVTWKQVFLTKVEKTSIYYTSSAQKYKLWLEKILLCNLEYCILVGKSNWLCTKKFSYCNSGIS